MDVGIAAAGLLVALPVIVPAALVLRLATGPGPVLVRVPRTGAGGRRIELLRLRTTSVAGRPARSPRSARSRASRLGRGLRRFHIHRLPELWNVVRGDTSLVGPRAARFGRIDPRNPIGRLVLQARPGLTGLAQLGMFERPLGGRGGADGRARRDVAASALRLDAWYVEHQSVPRDLLILGRAVGSAARSLAGLLAQVLPRPARAEARAAAEQLSRAFRERLGRLRGRHFLALDLLAVAGATYLAMALRFESLTGTAVIRPYWPVLLLPVLVRPLVSLATGLYDRLWRQATLPDLVLLVRAALVGSVVCVATFYLVLLPLGVPGSSDFPRSFWVVEGLLSLSFTAAPRLVLAATRDRAGTTGDLPPRRRPALLYGAGEVGAMIARSAAREPGAGVRPVGFLDDDVAIAGQRVAGLRVFGGVEAMPEAMALTGSQLLLITMAAAPGSAIRRVTEAGLAAGLEVRTVPPLHELLDGSLDAFRVRHVQVEDLIRRPQVARRPNGVEAIVRDHVVVVTGAGGSIGSELARQIFAMAPRRLVLVDRAESPMYAIERELEVRAISGRASGEVVVRLANVASRERMRHVIEEAAPNLVVHAAAYKHVPLMEAHPSEAVQVNVGGTLAVLDAAVEAGTPHFVLVSTDKAVAPTSVMGATKRLAEWVVADSARRTGHPHVSVRFGNVIGSAGSVVPIFQGQLESGQPLTITHPDMTRYFMTIAEASSLILEAAALGQAGDLFVLDMGRPIRILDLARDLVRLAGRDPDTVPIAFTGLRPGEKLHERLFYDHESARPTANAKVMLAEGGTPPLDVRGRAFELLHLADGNHDDRLRAHLFRILGAEADPRLLAPDLPETEWVPVHALTGASTGAPGWTAS